MRDRHVWSRGTSQVAWTLLTPIILSMQRRDGLPHTYHLEKNSSSLSKVYSLTQSLNPSLLNAHILWNNQSLHETHPLATTYVLFPTSTADHLANKSTINNRKAYHRRQSVLHKSCHGLHGINNGSEPHVSLCAACCQEGRDWLELDPAPFKNDVFEDSTNPSLRSVGCAKKPGLENRDRAWL